MDWSQLPRRKKQAAVAIGVILLIILVALALAGRNKAPQASDQLPGGAPALDSGGYDNRTNRGLFKTTDTAGAVKAAFLDGITAYGQGDRVGETDATGLGSLSLATDACYTVRATDKASSASGSVVVAVGIASGCAKGAIVLKTANSTPIAIPMK